MRIDWKDEASAPRDGTVVLARSKEDGVFFARWDADGWCGSGPGWEVCWGDPEDSNSVEVQGAPFYAVVEEWFPARRLVAKK